MPPKTNHKPILRVTRGECRFPTAEPAPRQHRFCAAPVRPGSPYCDHHHDIARRPAPRLEWPA